MLLGAASERFQVGLPAGLSSLAKPPPPPGSDRCSSDRGWRLYGGPSLLWKTKNRFISGRNNVDLPAKQSGLTSPSLWRPGGRWELMGGNKQAPFRQEKKLQMFHSKMIKRSRIIFFFITGHIRTSHDRNQFDQSWSCEAAAVLSICFHGDLPGSLGLIRSRTSNPVCLTVLNEVLDDVFAAGLDGVMQQRAAVCVLQLQVCPLLVELRQLQGNRRHLL